VTLTTHRDGDVSAMALHGTADQAGRIVCWLPGSRRVAMYRCCETSHPGTGRRVKFARAGSTWLAVSRPVSALSSSLRSKCLTWGVFGIILRYRGMEVNAGRTAALLATH